MYHPQKNRTIVLSSWLSIAAGFTVLLGWIFDIPPLRSIVPGFDGMKLNAALCFILLGSALLITQLETSKNSNLFFFILSAITALIGLVTLSEDIFHYNSGLDELFIADHTALSNNISHPGRMAFNAAFNFFFLGLGLLCLLSKKRLFTILSQFFFNAVTVLSAIALIGYLYGVSFFRVLFYKTSMATHTAILFFIISLAASLLNSSIGIAWLFICKCVGK